jgi:hypothetical protein
MWTVVYNYLLEGGDASSAGIFVQCIHSLSRVYSDIRIHSGFTPLPLVFTPVPSGLAPLGFFASRPVCGLFPIFHPQPRNVLTTFGVTAAVSGTRRKMKDLWIA